MQRCIGILVACALVLVLRAARAAEAPKALHPHGSLYTLSVIPFYGPEKMWALYAPFVEQLRKTTGQPWELKLYSDHDSLIADLCSGDVSIALLGPVPLGRANRQCGARPVLVALGKDGKPFYRSVIVTIDPAVTELRMLAGRKFGLFEGSTAAHIVPLKMLKDAGLGEGSVDLVYFEGQDRIMTALLTREVDAAGVKESLYRKFRNEPIRALRTSDPLPNFAFCASPETKPPALDRLVAWLLKLKPLAAAADAATVRTWDDEIKNGFAAPDADFLPSVARLNDVYQEITREAR